jgi:EmrB/QacA subfamily drug resistance transporter
MATPTAAAAPSVPSPQEQPAVRTGLVLLVVSAAVFLASLDLFIVNIAFPAISADFAADTAGLSWVLNAYTIGFAALLAPAGRTADRIGRRRVFLIGLAVFVLASLGCATAWDVASLTGFRVLQAVGAALLMSTSLALLLHSFPPDRRAKAIAVWSAVGGVAAALGPPVGGLLVEAASWRWVFLVNAPVGIAALVVGLRVLPESRDVHEHRRPDVVGTALLVVGVALLAWTMVDAPEQGWVSGRTLGSAAVAVLLLAAAVLRAARTPRGLVPVLPLALLRTRTFALACLAGLAFFTSFGAMLLGNVLWLTGGWGMSALEAGLLLVPGPALAAAFAVPGGRLGARFGCGQVASVGMALFALGALWWLWRVDVEQEYVTAMLPGLLLTGTGVGLTITNLSAAVSSTLPPAVLATGTATFAAARQLGATFGVALLLGVVPGGRDVLEGAQRGWVLVVAVAVAAGVTALLIGRAHHPDLALASRTTPATGAPS